MMCLTSLTQGTAIHEHTEVCVKQAAPCEESREGTACWFQISAGACSGENVRGLNNSQREVD